jgi:geranylgeranyl pyrophosphate synthase
VERSITDFLLPARERVERELDRLLPPAATEPTSLHEAMRYAVFSGGKRLRPICALLACAAVTSEGDELEAGAPALPAACALEMIHTYSLVHDDLPCMDDDDLRRGRPTVHKVYGEAIGVLAGDGLLTHAFEIVARELPSAISAKVAAAIARGAGPLGMVGGQALDLDAEGKALPAEAILAIDRKKTAALFAAAFEAGAWCGGASQATAEQLSKLGLHLGIAFQIVDDLLDLTATSSAMGKATGKDAARGKATLPGLLGFESARAQAQGQSDAARAIARGLRRGRLIEDLIGTMLERSS